jgi:tetratricopeptide (TPR) repeat protein
MAGLNRYEPAIDAFNHVIALNPSESAAYINLASCYSGLQQEQKALELYEKAFQFTPAFRTDIPINHEYGFTLVALGRIDEAARVFDQMKAATEPSKKERGSRSAALLDMYRGRYADAIAELRRAILIGQANKLGVSEYRDRLILVRALQSRRMTNEAAAELATVDRLISTLSLGPEWLSIALRIRARRGDVADARGLLDAMIRTAGNATSDSAMNRNLQLDGALVDLGRGEVFLAEGQPAKAIEKFEAAHVLLKRSESLESLAAAYHAAGRLEDAAKCYEDLLSRPQLGREVQEDWLHAYVALAQIREKQGQRDAARDLYQRLLTTWKDADADAVLLSQARAGRARTT